MFVDATSISCFPDRIWREAIMKLVMRIKQTVVSFTECHHAVEDGSIYIRGGTQSKPRVKINSKGGDVGVSNMD